MKVDWRLSVAGKPLSTDHWIGTTDHFQMNIVKGKTMDLKTFTAMIVTEHEDQTFVREIREKSIDELPEGDVLVRVNYSSLNYKDALSATGNKGVTKKYPHTPGIDAAGMVEASSSDMFNPGDAVIVTSYDLGMNTPGGFGQYIRVPADWVVSLPENFSLRESMVYGTAGFTAALSIFRLESMGINPESGPVLVTGATGGVGSLAVAMLAKAGYHVVAASGKPDAKQLLLDIGAQEVIHRDEVNDDSSRPLSRSRWTATVDTVGGNILATALKSTAPQGVVTCCGNVASPKLHITVFPFILRGVSLVGIDSQNCPMEVRRKIWAKLAGEWKLDNLDRLATEITLEALDPKIELILKGKLKGRVCVNLMD